MNCRHVTPVDRAPRSGDHSDDRVELGRLPGRPRNHPHRQGIVGWQRQDQHPGIGGTNPRATAQRVMFPVGMRIIVDTNDQVDRLRRRVVDRYGERRHARPIDRRFGRPNYELGPIGRFEIDPRGDAAGIDGVPVTCERRAFVAEMRAASAGFAKPMIGVKPCSAPRP